MTQKELLYLEDAIGHEKNIISILEDNLNNIEEENLSNFLKQELEKHTTTKETLLNLMEEKTNE